MSDIKLYYEKSGKGTPIVLLHGNGEDHACFAGQMPVLSERFTVYAVDTRGHGQSLRGTAPFTLDQFADDLKAFLDEHGIARAHIYGFSDGANIAMLFALRYPERLLSLVLNSGNLDPNGLVPWFLSDIEKRYDEICDVNTEGARYEAALIRLMLDEPHISPESLKAIQVPTLVIAGNEDLITEAHTRLIGESIPKAKLVILPGTHGVAQENRDTFNAALLDFFNDIGA